MNIIIDFVQNEWKNFTVVPFIVLDYIFFSSCFILRVSKTIVFFDFLRVYCNFGTFIFIFGSLYLPNNNNNENNN